MSITWCGESADYLKTEEDIKNYLAAVFEEPMDRQMLIHTLGVVARKRPRVQDAQPNKSLKSFDISVAGACYRSKQVRYVTSLS